MKYSEKLKQIIEIRNTIYDNIKDYIDFNSPDKNNKAISPPDSNQVMTNVYDEVGDYVETRLKNKESEELKIAICKQSTSEIMDITDFSNCNSFDDILDLLTYKTLVNQIERKLIANYPEIMEN